MSARFRWVASSSKRTAVPSNSSASWTARSKVRFVTRIPLAPAESRCRAASSHISPAPISITGLSVRSPRIFFASSTAAYETETALFATRVSRAHPLGDRERLREELVEHRPDRLELAGVPVGVLHLPEDLRLPEHHRVEAAGDAEQVPHRLFPEVVVEVVRQLADRDAVEAGEEILHVAPRPCIPSSERTQTSTRLQVERMTPSAMPSRSRSPRRACPTVSAGNARRSRTSTGAVRWFRPTMTISLMSALPFHQPERFE